MIVYIPVNLNKFILASEFEVKEKYKEEREESYKPLIQNSKETVTGWKNLFSWV